MIKNICLSILFIVLPFSVFTQEVDFKQDWEKLVISKLSSEFIEKLSSTQDLLKISLSKSSNNNGVSSQEKPDSTGDERYKHSDIKENSFKLKKLIRLLSYVSIPIFLILIILLWIRTNRDRIINTVLDSQRINKKYLDEDMKKLKSTNTAHGSNNMNLDKRISNLEIQLNSIISRLDSIEPYLKLLMKDDLNSQKNSTQEKNQLPQTVSKIVKYLKTAKDGVFNNTYDTPAGCYYELFNINGNQADFKFYGDSTEAIANKNAVFDNVCESSGISTTAKKVISDEPGILTSLSDGKWKVTQKAKIRFE